MPSNSKSFLLALALAACSTPDPVIPPPVHVATVAVDAPRPTMDVGEQMLLTATPQAANGDPLERDVAWSSDNAARATVTGAGVVTALSPGAVTIRATSEGKTGSVQLNLQTVEPPPPPPPPPITEVILVVSSPMPEVGERVQVGVTLKLASGEVVQRPVMWASSAPTRAAIVATDPAFGQVEARAAGTAVIMASAEGITATVTLEIVPRPAHDLLYARSFGTGSEIAMLSLGSVAAPVRLNAGDAAYNPSPSPDGTQVAFAVSHRDPLGVERHDLYLVNRNGLNLRWLTRTDGTEAEPRWSPDGTRILFRGTDDSGINSDLYVVNTDGTELRNLTATLPEDVSNLRHPSWSPDGQRIAFIAARDGQHKVWVMRANGNDAAPLTVDAGFDQSPTWAPDGSRIAFSRYNTDERINGWDILIVSLHDASTQRLALPGDQFTPAWSPDGEYLALAGTVVAGVGQYNLFTMRPDGTALRIRTVNPQWGGGYQPAWMVRQ